MAGCTNQLSTDSRI